MNYYAVKKIQMGEYLVLPAHNKLIFRQQEYKVEPKIMQVLCFLFQHQGDVVSRKTIAECLWPDTVTGLDVVTRAIFELRKILNDDPKNPKFIETIARKGYSFIYPLETKTAEANSEHKLTTKKNISRYLVAVFVAIALIILLLLIKTSQPNHKPQYQSSLLTDTGINVNAPSISPSWDKLLFIKSEGKNNQLNQLILLDLKTQSQQTITETSGNLRTPVWSNDGQYWFYIHCVTSKCELIKHTIADDKQTVMFSTKQKIISLAKSPSKNLFALAVLQNSLTNIVTLDMTGDTNKLDFLTTPVEAKGKPLFSLDGQTLFFVSWVRGGAAHLHQYNISTKKLSALSNQFNTITGLTNKSKDELWISGRQNGKSAIWRFNIKTNIAERVFDGAPGEFHTDIATTPNHSSLIYKSLNRTINIEQIGLNELPSTAPINSSKIDMNAIFSSKRHCFYFISNRSGSYEIWRYQNGETEKITNLTANLIERPIISRSENQLAFINRLQTTNELTILDLATNEVTATYSLPDRVFLLSWSNDEDSIFMSAVEDGQYNVYQFDFSSQKNKKILLNAELIAKQSNDGNTLYFGNMDTRQLMAKEKNNEIFNKFQLPDHIGKLLPHQATVIDDDFYYIDTNADRKTLKSYSFKTKLLTQHMTLPNNTYVTQIGFTDQPFVIYDRLIADQSQLVYLKEN